MIEKNDKRISMYDGELVIHPEQALAPILIELVQKAQQELHVSVIIFLVFFV